MLRVICWAGPATARCVGGFGDSDGVGVRRLGGSAAALEVVSSLAVSDSVRASSAGRSAEVVSP